jgi:hypothetical protein
LGGDLKPASEIVENDYIMFGGLTYKVNEIGENVMEDVILTLVIPKPIDLDELISRIVVIIPKHMSVHVLGR